MSEDGLAFQIKDKDYFRDKEKVLVCIDYFDMGSNRLYFNHIDQYGTKQQIPITKLGDAQWKRAIIQLEKDSFTQRASLYLGSDFYLDASMWAGRMYHDNLFISRIILKGFNEEQTQLFSQYDKDLKEFAAVYGEILALEAKYNDLLRQASNLVEITANQELQIALSACFDAIGMKEKTKSFFSIYRELYTSGNENFFFGNHKQNLEKLQEADSLKQELTSAYTKGIEILEQALAKASDSPVSTPSPVSISSDLYSKEKFGKSIIIGATQTYDQNDFSSFRALELDFITPTYGGQTPHPPFSSKADGTFVFGHSDATIKRYKEDTGAKTGGWPLFGCFADVYLPSWFTNKYGNEVHLQSEDGYIDKRTANIWHPAVRQFAQDFFTATGKYYSNNPDILFWSLWNEGYLGIYSLGSMSASITPGFSKHARAAFREYLQNKYSSIAELNGIWKTSYNSFAEINPPSAGQSKVTPSVYEFRRFLDDSWLDFIHLCRESLQRGDPNHPIFAQAIDGDDKVNLNRDWDLYSYHAGGGISGQMHDFISFHPFAYSMNYYSKPKDQFRTLANDEYWWGADDTLRNPNDEELAKAVLERGLWQSAAWGVSVFEFFMLYGDADNWGCNMMDKHLDYSVIRPAIASLPVLKEKLNRFVYIFQETELLHDGIAVLYPTTSVLLATDKISYPIKSEMNRLYNLLARKHQEAFFIPEEAIMADDKALQDYKVLVVPYAPFFPEGLAEKLDMWVAEGGYLVLSGPAGVYNQYGFADNQLIRKVLGMDGFERTQNRTLENTILTSQPETVWKHTQGQPKGEILASFSDGSPAAVVGTYGKGKVLLANFLLSLEKDFHKIFSDFVCEKIINPRVFSPIEEVELVLRKDLENHNLYLTVINLDGRRDVSCPIIVKDVYQKVYDLTLGEGCLLPSESVKGYTIFELKLQPGEGRQILLCGGRESQEQIGVTSYLGQLFYLRMFLRDAAASGIKLGSLEKVVEDAFSALEQGEFILSEEQLAASMAEAQKALSLKSRESMNERLTRIIKDLEKIGNPVRKARIEVLVSSGEMALKKQLVDLAEEYLGVAERYLYSGAPIERNLAIDLQVQRAKSKIVIDGELSEWAREFPAYISSGSIADGNNNGDEDISAQFDCQWDDDYLYFAFKVKDNQVLNTEETKIWEGDCIELFINTLDDQGLPIQEGAGIGMASPTYGPDDIQFLFAVNGKQIVGGANPLWQPIGKNSINYEFAVKAVTGGYSMEIAIPWKELMVKPVPDYTLGLDVAVDDWDGDGNGRKCQLVWKGTKSNFQRTSGWGRIILK